MLNGLLGFIYYVDFCTLLLVGNFINNAKSTNYKVSNFKWCWWLFNNNPFLWKHRSLLITILDFCMSIHDTSVFHHVMSSRSLISTEKHLGWPRKARSICNSEYILLSQIVPMWRSINIWKGLSSRMTTVYCQIVATPVLKDDLYIRI